MADAEQEVKDSEQVEAQVDEEQTEEQTEHDNNVNNNAAEENDEQHAEETEDNAAEQENATEQENVAEQDNIAEQESPADEEQTADPVTEEVQGETTEAAGEQDVQEQEDEAAQENTETTTQDAQLEEQQPQEAPPSSDNKEELTEDRKVSEEVQEEKVARTTEAAQHVGTGTDVPEGGVVEAEVDPLAPTPEPRIDRDATATVRFVLLPSGQVATLRCNLTQTLQELKDHFATELKMPSSVILLMFDGKNMDSKLTLSELGVGPNGTIQLEMQSADPVNTPIKAIRPRQEYHMPDVITVRVATEDGSDSDIVVEIERTTRKKPYLGGYRHKQTNVEYHHASAQTMQKARPISSVERYCRDTQTVQQMHRVQQTKNDMCTQMTNIGVYVSNLEDKLVVPGKYTTADEYHQTVFTKIVVLQKYYRRWLAKRYVEKVRRDKDARLEWEREEEIRKRKKKKVPTATLR